jgi:hypothetical protein
MHAGERLLEMAVGGGCVVEDVGFAASDGGAAEILDGIVERIACLLAQDLAEQRAERANISAKRGFLQFASGGLKFCEALGPVGWRPQGRHDLIMHRRLSGVDIAIE